MEINLELEQAVTYGAIFLMAIVPIYIGSHLSLKLIGISTKKEVVIRELTDLKVESMSAEDAWKFPVIGSFVLFGLFILFKIFSKEIINLIAMCYFLLFGFLAVWATLKPIVVATIFPSTKDLSLLSIQITRFWRKKEENDTHDQIHIGVDQADFVSGIIAASVSAWYFGTKHWIANNIFGLCFSIQGISILSLGSYKIGCILLSGLFFYDIFWVFGTDVMVTVARNFDGPIKVMFPKHLFAEELEFSILGLGDIVVPGIFIALLLRYDASKSLHKAFSKVYFHVTYIAYCIGLCVTVLVMHAYQTAQPALLYLVPACIGSSLFAAVLRRELIELISYVEEDNDKAMNTDKQN